MIFRKPNEQQQSRPDGLPGVRGMQDALPAPGVQAQLLTQSEDVQRIGKEEISKAAEILTRYKHGKANLENRIVEDELWWELRHWEVIRRQKDPNGPMPSSAWLFNAITNKHADAMDNYPEPIVLPREPGDRKSAESLSQILPVVMEYNDFEKVWSDNWWEKLKHGTAAYGVFWDSRKENGLGDIDITRLDLTKIFWEPGVEDIQDSRNLFLTELVDTDLLEALYPDRKGKLGGKDIDLTKYCYDDDVDTSGKSLVVDWYYKVQALDGRQVVHYAKFVGTELLYASENDPKYRDNGYFEHGLYPVVFDTLYPEKGTPVGFGLVTVCRDPQMYIDQLSGNILESSMMGTKKRFFASTSTNINKKQFLDWQDPFVDVEGEIDDRRLKEIEVRPLDSIYLSVLQMKVDEMKETASNRDVNSGSSGSGVTSGAAISALQEAGNKGSRDMISGSYRAYTQIVSMCLELMRQFYDESRAFRITGDSGNYSFVDWSNQNIREQPTGFDSEGRELYRRPVFDIKVKAQKKNPFSRMEQNERAKELYSMGFFQPENAQNALGALSMMEFEGKDNVEQYIQQGQTLLNMLQQMSRQMDQMAMIIQATTGKDMGIGNQAQMPGTGSVSSSGGSGSQSAGGRLVDQAVNNQTSLQQKMAEGARA